MGYIGVITHLLTIDPNFLGHLSGVTLPNTNNSHLKIDRNPKGKECLPTINFQGRNFGETVFFREGKG